jgi:hypothetical protein
MGEAAAGGSSWWAAKPEGSLLLLLLEGLSVAVVFLQPKAAYVLLGVVVPVVPGVVAPE